MKNTVKKLIQFRFNQYKDIELKLEKLARQGLFLKEMGLLFWTFKKSEPRNIKYTVTYFSEASIFNPAETDNQLTYFDYAKEVGWSFVAQYNQMQVFASENENPVPFESDERQKFYNIKKCMGRTFLPSTIVLILAFSVNLIVLYHSYRRFPIDFLAETYKLFSVAVIFSIVAYFIYTLLSYFVWCKKSEKSINNGGGCIEKTHTCHKTIDAIFLIYLFCIMALFMLNMAINSNLLILIFGVIQIPILFILFQFSIKLFKKKKQPALKNKFITYSLLTIASFVYIVFISFIVIRFDIRIGEQNSYRTVTLQFTPTESHNYKLYNDDIPMTCEDLYGSIDYEYYSYEKNIDNTIFLTRSEFRQYSLPTENSPPQIEYTVFEPKLGFVYNIIEEELKRVPEWSDRKMKLLDNKVFDTEEAYQFYYGTNSTGDYLLFYKNKLILLNLDEPATQKQISIIKNKLRLD